MSGNAFTMLVFIGKNIYVCIFVAKLQYFLDTNKIGGLFFGNSMKFAFRVQVNSIVNLAE